MLRQVICISILKDSMESHFGELGAFGLQGVLINEESQDCAGQTKKNQKKNSRNRTSQRWQCGAIRQSTVYLLTIGDSARGLFERSRTMARL
jgi:hypothetical protein